MVLRSAGMTQPPREDVHCSLTKPARQGYRSCSRYRILKNWGQSKSVCNFEIVQSLNMAGSGGGARLPFSVTQERMATDPQVVAL
jgi:hypothetical protein